jgi:hypothetical protein
VYESPPALAGKLMNCLQLQLEDKRSKFIRALAKYLLIATLST